MQGQRDDIAAAARDKWHAILPKLGISPKHLSGRHGPCPKCGGKDRFRFDNREGRGTWICNGCGAGDGFDLLMLVTGHGFGEIARKVRGCVDSVPADERRRKAPAITLDQQRRALKQMYQQSDRISRGDPVDTYLRSRGLGMEAYPPTLRIIRSLPYPKSQEVFPVMLAIMQCPDGRCGMIHRTFLMPDGSDKAPVDRPRLFMAGEIPEGSAVRLSHPGRIMGVAEGIETALSAQRVFGIPTWAALNTSLMEKWQPPDEAREVIIFSDADHAYGGQKAAYTLAHRLVREGRNAKVEMPPALGEDWNDMLKHMEAA